MSKYKNRLWMLNYEADDARSESAFTSKIAIGRKANISKNYKRLANRGSDASDWEADLAKDQRDWAQGENIKGRKRTQKGIRLADTKLRRYKNAYKKVVRRKVGLGLGVAGALAGTAALVAKARSAKKDQ